MTEQLQELLKQDFTALISGAFFVMAGVIAMTDVIGRFSVIVGKPVKWVQNKEKELEKSISELSNKLDEIQQKNNKRIRAELKDKISQSYRYYHSLGKINDMELEALEDLIEEYETAQGQNSFVHSVVQKEMYTWERIMEGSYERKSN